LDDDEIMLPLILTSSAAAERFCEEAVEIIASIEKLAECGAIDAAVSQAVGENLRSVIGTLCDDWCRRLVIVDALKREAVVAAQKEIERQ
jgi:hypothetical protein